MTTFEIEVKERDGKQKPAALREQGALPAVFYGPKEEATSVTLDAKKFEKVWKETGGSAIVVLKGIGDDKEALIHEVDVHPVTGNLQHADLYVIERGKKLEVSVPIEFVGEAPAEKAGHVIVKVMHEVDIKVRPSELPQNFEVDVSGLEEVGDSITVNSVKLPESGEFETDPQETLIIVKEARAEPEPTEEDAATIPAEDGDGEGGEVPKEEGGEEAKEE